MGISDVGVRQVGRIIFMYATLLAGALVILLGYHT
jgi:hypothetical protein